MTTDPADRDEHAEGIRMRRELVAEIASLGNATQENESPYYYTFPDLLARTHSERRVLVRSIFAYIEATTWSLKMFAIDLHSIPLEPQEILLAREDSYEILKTGELKRVRSRIGTLNNIRFAFRLAAKAEGAEYRMDASGKGWQAVQDTSAVRDRLMHPKCMDDLTVKDYELEASVLAFNWFTEQLRLLYQSILLALEAAVAADVSREGDEQSDES